MSCVPAVLVRVFVCGVQYLCFVVLYGAEQRAHFRCDLLFADARVPDGLCAHPASDLRRRRHLVRHHGRGGLRDASLRELPACEAEKISLYVNM